MWNTYTQSVIDCVAAGAACFIGPDQGMSLWDNVKLVDEFILPIFNSLVQWDVSKLEILTLAYWLMYN